jgi:hypothetical protein
MKDLALYILICVFVLTAIAGLASTGMKWDILFKLLQSLMFPILLFGIAVPKRRSRWANGRFRLTVGAALLIHAFLFAILASRVEHLKPIITAALAFVEFLVWVISDGWLLEHATRTSNRSGSKAPRH